MMPLDLWLCKINELYEYRIQDSGCFKLPAADQHRVIVHAETLVNAYPLHARIAREFSQAYCAHACFNHIKLHVKQI